MALSAATLKGIKDQIRNIPNVSTQNALFAMLDALDTAIDGAYHPVTSSPIADGDIDASATPVLTVENGIITAAAAAE